MQEQVTSWIDSLANASQVAVSKVLWFVPNLVFALIVLLVGAILGRWMGRLVQKVLGKIKLPEFTPSLNVNRYLEPFGMRSVEELLGKLVYLFVVLVAVIAAADILRLPQVTMLMQTILFYIPKAIVALLILLVAIIAARLSDSFLKADVIQQIPALKGLVRFLIITFALLAALEQFDISPRLIEILFAGLILAMSLGAGIAFGLGGKDAARDLLERLRQKRM